MPSCSASDFTASRNLSEICPRTTGDGIVQFRNDIYNYDFGSNAIALNQDASQIGTPVAQ